MKLRLCNISNSISVNGIMLVGGIAAGEFFCEGIAELCCEGIAELCCEGIAELCCKGITELCCEIIN